MKQGESKDSGENPPGRANPGCRGVRGVLPVILALGLAGCGSLDRDFRTRVGDIDLEASNTFDDANAGISDQSSVGIDFKLRDPKGDGKEILPATYGK